jgi:hypothetical protein
MEIRNVDYSFEDVISALENPFIQNLKPIDFGKAIQSAVEEYIHYKVNEIADKQILFNLDKNPNLVEEFKYSNNGPGFDRLLLPVKKKIQIKFRQVNGKTPYSKQIHFENTRRLSEKNQNSSSNTGHVRYSINEFDYVLIVICHIEEGLRKKYKDWSYSLIKSEELEDVNNRGYCLPHVPSALLLENSYDNIYMLTTKLINLSNHVQ